MTDEPTPVASLSTPDPGAATPEAPDADGSRPSERILIGTQRPVEPSAAPVEPPRPAPVLGVGTKGKPEPKKYPPPNVRSQLSPELEAELEAALAGESLDALIDQSAATVAPELAPESRVTATVLRVHGEDVFVDLGGHRQGLLPLAQVSDDASVAVGSTLELVVVRHNPDEGLYQVSLTTAAIEVGNWDDVEVGRIVEVQVTGANKGGLECEVAGIRGFIPMGQVSIYRVETPEDYVGQRLACVVTEANRDRRNLVLSHRATMERERAEKRDKLLAELAPGQLREGVVRSLRDFGAFVDLGGVDGLIHVSKMSWDRINHPSEVLAEGQAVRVRIDKIDAESGKISLSYREMTENPWEKAEGKYYVGASVSGAVSKVMDFGAFVKLEPGVEGLIHISELAHGRVFRTSDVVAEGQKVDVKVLSFDREKQRIGLSLKALQARPEKPGEQKVADEDLPLPADAPKPPKRRVGNLKGGIGGPSGGEQFGLRW